MEKETQEQINELQQIEQTISSMNLQKQQFSGQLLEIESALSEIGKSPKAYKIIGNIMVESKSDELTNELKEKKEIVALRIQTFEKQERVLKEKGKKIQGEVMSRLQKQK